jgi:hypothetical protein
VFVGGGEELLGDEVAGYAVVAVLASSLREWSWRKLRISTSVPSARCQWVKSDCQHWLGWAAAKRRYDERGLLRGLGHD